MLLTTLLLLPVGQLHARDDTTGPDAPKAPKQPASSDKLAKLFDSIQFGALWYLRYRHGKDNNDAGELEEYDNFHVGRGYLTVKFKPTKWFQGRITADAHQDEAGDWKVRLKYLYAKFKLPVETAVVSDPYLEFGIVHMPWLDYEEHINYYRMQGTMFAERNKLFNSADLGLTLGVLLGPKLDKHFQKTVNRAYPGKWGSLAVGVYNGGGYHAIEQSTNKVVEGRLSVRPLGWILPHLQLSYFFVLGKGNAKEGHPNWRNHLFMLSFDHQYTVLTGTFIMGSGNQKGSLVDDDGEAKSFKGASGFLEVKLPWIWSSVVGRYDWFDGPNPGGDDPYHRIIAGYAFHFYGRNRNVILVDFDYRIFDAIENEWALTLTLQVKL